MSHHFVLGEAHLVHNVRTPAFCSKAATAFEVHNQCCKSVAAKLICECCMQDQVLCSYLSRTRQSPFLDTKPGRALHNLSCIIIPASNALQCRQVLDNTDISFDKVIFQTKLSDMARKASSPICWFSDVTLAVATANLLECA